MSCEHWLSKVTPYIQSCESKQSFLRAKLILTFKNVLNWRYNFIYWYTTVKSQLDQCWMSEKEFKSWSVCLRNLTSDYIWGTVFDYDPSSLLRYGHLMRINALPSRQKFRFKLQLTSQRGWSQESIVTYLEETNRWVNTFFVHS